MDDAEKSELTNQIWGNCKAAGFVKWMTDMGAIGGASYYGSNQVPLTDAIGKDIINEKEIKTDDYGDIILKIPIKDGSKEYSQITDSVLEDLRALVYLKGYNSDTKSIVSSFGTYYLNSLALAKRYDAYVSDNGSPSGFKVGSCDIVLSDCEYSKP